MFLFSQIFFLILFSSNISKAAGYSNDSKGNQCYTNKYQKKICQGWYVKVKNRNTKLYVREVDEGQNQEGMVTIVTPENRNLGNYLKFSEVEVVN